MSGRTWAFVGLEHAIAEGVLLSNLKVRLNVRRLNIRILRVCRGTIRDCLTALGGYKVSAIHFTAVIHGVERAVTVVKVVIVHKRSGPKSNCLAQGVETTLCNVSPTLNQDGDLEISYPSSGFLER